jgi:hypothetical protein
METSLKSTEKSISCRRRASIDYIQYPDLIVDGVRDDDEFSLVFQESFKFDKIDFDMEFDLYVANDTSSTQRKDSDEIEYECVEKYLF